MNSQDGLLWHSLQPGHYRLTSDFVGTKLDKRLSGRGWRAKAGFASGTRFSIREEYGRKHFFVLEAPFIEDPMSSRVYGHRFSGDPNIIVWAPDDAADLLRLMNALVPDTSSATWLSHAVGRTSTYMHGQSEEILLELLDSGRVSKEEIVALFQKIRAQKEGMNIPSSTPSEKT